VKYTVIGGVYLFIILPEPHNPNGISHLDHNASIDADILSRKCLLGVSRFAKKIQGVTFAPNRELHGNGDDGNTAVDAVFPGNGDGTYGNTAGMETTPAVTPREWI
jgi:hypothetical protein